MWNNIKEMVKLFIWFLYILDFYVFSSYSLNVIFLVRIVYILIFF